MDYGETPATGLEKLMRHSRVQVLVSQRLRIGREWKFDLCSPFWRLYVNDRSGAFLHHQGRRLPLAAGTPWIIPAWMRFQTSLQRPVTQDFIHFQVTGPLTRSVERRMSSPVRLQSGIPLSPLIERWRGGLDRMNFSHFCWANATAHAALAVAFAGWTTDDQHAELRLLAEHEAVQPALDCIDRHPEAPPSNPDLARLCGTSEDHFIRKFRSATGSTPAGYGRKQRISLAAEWLTGTNRTLDDIAEASGFTDRFHFSRVFKAQLGFPPATYRRTHRIQDNPEISQR
ncbi:MAG: helix-turn-helix domain-containing protein [Terrimicrobiaceae bacterium]